jgi:tetratricopeptide (TPR) repeat protein
LSEHPTSSDLEAFAKGSLPPGSLKDVVRHLLRGCRSCSALLASSFEGPGPARGIEASPESSRAYDEALDRTLSTLRFQQQYHRSEEIRRRRVAALLEAGGGLQALIDRLEISLQGLGVLKAVLDRSWAVRHENPREMVELARFAVSLAGKLNPRWHNEKDAADWQARAWGELGNALRTREDYDEAERAFGTAFSFLLQGSGDLRLKARLYDLHASFLGTLRRFDLTFTALDIVHATYLELGDTHLAGRVLLVKALYTFYNNEADEAMRVNQAGMALIEEHRDPGLFFAAIYNQLLFRVGCGQFIEARRELFGYLEKFKDLGRLNQLKIRWLQAQINAGLRRWQRAEQGFLFVVEGFEKEGLAFDAAFASLELAIVWMHQGKYEETQRLIPQVYEAFVSLRIKKEALGAMMVLKEAFEKQMGTIGLLEDVVEFLRRWYINPDERFRPRGE